MRFSAIFGVGVALFLSGMSAQAASLHYKFDRITGNASESLSQQLGMEVESRTGGALFTFRNNLGIASSITDIYFDDKRGGLFRSIAYSTDSGVGVSFDSQAAPANLPGGKAIGFSASFSGDSNNRSVEQGVVTKGVPANGVNQSGEWVSFLGFWAGAANFDGLLAAINNGNFRVGLHAQAIGLAGVSDSYVNQPSAVPLPAAAWLFASALFGFVVISNRRKL